MTRASQYDKAKRTGYLENSYRYIFHDEQRNDRAECWRCTCQGVYFEIDIAAHSLIGWYRREGGGGVVQFLRCAHVPSFFLRTDTDHNATANAPQSARKHTDNILQNVE